MTEKTRTTTNPPKGFNMPTKTPTKRAAPAKRAGPSPKDLGGRPKVYNERVQMQVRLAAAVNERLEIEAARRLVSKNLLVENAVLAALERWEADSSLDIAR